MLIFKHSWAGEFKYIHRENNSYLFHNYDTKTFLITGIINSICHNNT